MELEEKIQEVKKLETQLEKVMSEKQLIETVVPNSKMHNVTVYLEL